MTHVAILGAAGRMGQALIRCAQRMEAVRIVAAMDQPGHVALGRDAGLLAGIDAIGVLLAGKTDESCKADVFIDFSSHAAAPANAALAASLGRGLVIGTTGLNKEETRAVADCASRIPIVCAPNMSLGVNLMFAMARKAASTLGLDYDVEIVETHHRHKKDAPSGTALRLAQAVAEGRGQDLDSVMTNGRCGLTGERPRGEIGVHALRAGDAVGDHTVIFATDGERVEISHRATSRDTFAMGALHAAVWVHGRKPGLYDMKDVLGL